MNKQRILLVAPYNVSEELLADHQPYRIAYRFVDETPRNGLCAWLSSDSDSSALFDVVSQCSAVQGGFGQQALNRVFAQAILRLRPQLVVIQGVFGCTADLPRVAQLLGVPAALVLTEDLPPPSTFDDATQAWLRASLQSARYIYHTAAQLSPDWLASTDEKHLLYDSLAFAGAVDRALSEPRPEYSFDYSLYELSQRDPSLLAAMQSPDTRHFAGCTHVLDLACGIGIFLDCLRRDGIEAVGVERDTRLAEYATGMGLSVIEQDALEYLELADSHFDGIYCSHFVEHLPVAMVERLLRLIADRLTPDGVLVLAFPDPESIRSQLLGFWRDPEHVRFYHPDLIANLAATVGLEVEWSSYDAQPHRTVPFAEAAPPVPTISPMPGLMLPRDIPTLGVVGRILGKLGFVSDRRLDNLQQQLQQWSVELQRTSQQYVAASEKLEQRTSDLWDVNQTWAWNDNVTLKLRKSVE